MISNSFLKSYYHSQDHFQFSQTVLTLWNKKGQHLLKTIVNKQEKAEASSLLKRINSWYVPLILHTKFSAGR